MVRKNKMKWKKPKLLVLSRQTSHEGILQTCKESPKVIFGPSEYFSACHFNWYRDNPPSYDGLILIQECLDCQHLDVS